MASILFEIECPQCKKVAIEDYYYKVGDKYVLCSHCGYNYTRLNKITPDNKLDFDIEENPGYGVFVLTKKAPEGKRYLLNSKPTEEQIQKYRDEFEKDDVIQEESYLVLYEDGELKCLFGTLPQDFLLSYDEFREKYGNDDDHLIDYEEELI
ncbi:hypothetical protein [Lederbergia graminis]|uniref:Uncharacterized protein n=1 Tax=Lederbergia graminis TaxID=735518 RepID=A0ABW0LGG8_9BACI|nr:hypothetical protein [Bacillaceae bacterium]